MKTASIDLGSLRAQGLERIKPKGGAVTVGMGTCGLGNGAGALFEAIKKACETEFHGSPLPRSSAPWAALAGARPSP